MKKTFAKFLLVCGVVAVLAAMLVLYATREPSHEGRPVSAWMADLKSKVPAERKAAAEALNAMGPEAAAYLAKQLSREPGILQKLNARIGGALPTKAKNGLRKVLKPGNDVMTKHAAADALKLMGTNGQEAIPALERTLNSQNVVLSSISGIALSEMGEAAVPVLLDALNSPDYNVRSSACSALGKLGTNAAPAVPVLVKILEEESGPILGTASYCLSRIGAPAVPHLLPLLQNTNSVVRRQALYSIKYMQRPLPDAYAEVRPLLEDPSPEVRVTALGALNQLDWHTPRHAETVLFALNDSNSNVLSAATQQLADRPRLVISNFSTCLALLESPVPNVRYHAAEALLRTGHYASNAIPHLEKLADDPVPIVREKAVQALESISNSMAAKASVPVADARRRSK